MRKRVMLLCVALLALLVVQSDVNAAWTTPKTWVSGETVTAAMMNTYIRDNQNVLAMSPRILDVNVTQTGTTAAASPQTLMSYTLPGGTVVSAGQGVRVTAWGTCASGLPATSRYPHFYIGSSDLGAIACTATIPSAWRWSVMALVVDATHGSYLGVTSLSSSISTSAYASALPVWASDMDFKVVAEMSGTFGANDIVALGMTVELIP